MHMLRRSRLVLLLLHRRIPGFATAACALAPARDGGTG